MEFFLAFLHRSLSGAHNGLGYAKKKGWFIVMNYMLLLWPVLTAVLIYADAWYVYTIVFIYILVLELKHASFGVVNSPVPEKWRDIHLWESFVTGLYVLHLIALDCNIIMVACSVYPALILHKGFVNWGSNLPFLSVQTDDSTGKTYSIPLLGIKVRRSGLRFRFTLAAVSLLIAAWATWKHINVSVSSFFD